MIQRVAGVALLFLGAHCASPAAVQAGDRATAQENKAEGPSLLLAPVQALISQHRQRGTHYDGPRCPMYPSCAAYADQAISEHGLSGFLLSIERLFFRESGNLSARYPIAPAELSSAPRYYDPVKWSLPWPAARKPSLLLDPPLD